MLGKKIHQCLFSTVLWKYSGKCWKKQAFLFLSSFSKSSWVTKQLCIQILSIIFQEGSGNDYCSEPRGVKQDQTCESPNHSEILMRQWFIFYCNPTFWLLVVISDRMALTNMFSLPWSIILSPEVKLFIADLCLNPEHLSRNPAGIGYCPVFFNTAHWGTELLSPISCFCVNMFCFIWSVPQNIILLQIHLKTRVNTELPHGRKAHGDWRHAKPVHGDWHWVSSLSP